MCADIIKSGVGPGVCQEPERMGSNGGQKSDGVCLGLPCRRELGSWVPLKSVSISGEILFLLTPLKQNALRDN